MPTPGKVPGLVLLAVACLLFPGSLASSAQTVERYLVADRGASFIRSFNVSDDTPAGTPRGGVGPRAVVVSPNGRLAYVAHWGSTYISVLDLTIQAEVARLGSLFPGVPGGLALTPDGTRLLVGNVFGDEFVVVDTSTFQVIQQASLGGFFGTAIAVVGMRAYVNTRTDLFTSGNAPVLVVDLNTMAVSSIPGTDVGYAPVAFHSAVPSGSSIAATPDGGHVVVVHDLAPGFSPGKIFIIETASNTVIQTIDHPASRAQAVTVAITPNAADPDGVFAYLPDLDSPFSGGTSVVDVLDLRVGSLTFGEIIATAQIPAGGRPTAVALTADGNRAYVVYDEANALGQNVFAVDTAMLLIDPPNAVVGAFAVGARHSAVAVAPIAVQPPASTPVVSGVSPTLVTNGAAATVHITGAGFAPDARVRIGNLEPVPATVLSPAELEAVVPAGAASQTADIIVTNPGSLVADQHQSGILRGPLVIASKAVFQPAHQALVAGVGQGKLSILNISNDATVAPTSPEILAPQGLEISPDGERAYVYSAIAFPADVRVYNILTSEIEASIRLPSTAGFGNLIGIGPHPNTGRPVAYTTANVCGPGGCDMPLIVIDIDPASPTFHTIIDTIPAGLTDTNSAGFLTSTPDGRFVYAVLGIANVDFATDAHLVVYDVANRSATVHSTAALGVHGIQAPIQVSPDNNSLVLARGTAGPDPELDGTLRVFDIGADPLNPSFVADIPRPAGSIFVICTFDGNRLYAFEGGIFRLEAFNFVRGAVNDFSLITSFTIPSLTGPTGQLGDIAVTSDGSLIYVGLHHEDAVAAIDTNLMLAGNPAGVLTRIGTGLASGPIAIRPGTPTLAGSTVQVQPIQQVAAAFDTVTTDGETSVATTYTHPLLTPAGLPTADPPIFYKLATTAATGGHLTGCISYDEAFVGSPENALRLMHEEAGLWVDRTVSRDTANNLICAEVSAPAGGAANARSFTILRGSAYQGRVADRSGAPIVGAAVAGLQGGNQQFLATTNDRGSYSLVVTDGTYDLVASQPGFFPKTRAGLAIGSFETLFKLQFKLFRHSFFQGTVTNKFTGAPIAGATIEAVKGGVTRFSTTSNPDGTYSLLLKAGTYTLRASAPGFKTKNKRDQTIGDGATKTANLALPPQ